MWSVNVLKLFLKRVRISRNISIAYPSLVKRNHGNCKLIMSYSGVINIKFGLKIVLLKKARLSFKFQSYVLKIRYTLQNLTVAIKKYES